MPAGVIVAGKIETGFVAIQDKIILSPNNQICTVKILYKNHGILFVFTLLFFVIIFTL